MEPGVEPARDKLVTLLELLRYHADAFVRITQYLTDLSHLCPGLGIEPETREQVRESLKLVRSDLASASLRVCVQHCDDLLQELETRDLTGQEVRGLQENVLRELATHVYLSVTPEKHLFFDQPRRKWEDIINRFPDCQDDVEEMNKCYAVSRYTASVFHSLLVVEHGLVALGKHIGAFDPKPGWDATYRELERLMKNRASVPPNLDFNFLEQTKSRLDSMKLAWRNKVNHAAGRLVIEKTGFTDVSAEEVIMACRSFMRHLAERLPGVAS